MTATMLFWMLVELVVFGAVAPFCWVAWLRHKRWLATEEHGHLLALREAKLDEARIGLDEKRLKLQEIEGKKALAAVEAAGNLLPSYNQDKVPVDQRNRALAIIEASQAP